MPAKCLQSCLKQATTHLYLERDWWWWPGLVFCPGCSDLWTLCSQCLHDSSAAGQGRLGTGSRSRGSRVQTDISPHQCRMRRQMKEHSCCCGLEICNSKHKCWEFVAWKIFHPVNFEKYLIENPLKCHHLGLEDDLTIGVSPMVNKFLVLLRLTILKMILWSLWTFSTEKLNQNLQVQMFSAHFAIIFALLQYCCQLLQLGPT